jgi:glutaredoxin-related protein
VTNRNILPTDKIATQALNEIQNFHSDVVEEVFKAVKKDKVVVIGMKQNPVVKKAVNLLNGQNIAFTYLEYGSYFSKWKQRLAIKLWSGWPTFPQIFVNGQLIGGFANLSESFKSGEFEKKMK